MGAWWCVVVPDPLGRVAHYTRRMAGSTARQRELLARILRPYRVSPGWWVAVAAALVLVDSAVGPHVQFTATFVMPVFLAAWYSGLGIALACAVGLPLIHLTLLLTFWEQPWDTDATLISAIVRITVFCLIALMVSRLAHHERELEHEVALLEGMLPICMHCKSIRNDSGEWESLEQFVSSRSEATFTHGVCDACARQHYADLYDRSSVPGRPEHKTSG